SLLEVPVHPREQHPFPTRRASDLLSSTISEIGRELATAKKDGAERKSVLSALIQTPATLLFSRRRMDSVGPLSTTTISYSRPARDRKSTRLNSSHVKISYAVFCLT